MVNHRCRILSTTYGHPACWNDKTIVLFDAFVRGIYEGKILDNHEFTLFELDEKGDVIKVQYQGAWLLVDSGNLNWPTTVPPFNHTIHYKEICFAMASVRTKGCQMYFWDHEGSLPNSEDWYPNPLC
jgi:hypothetical protein